MIKIKSGIYQSTLFFVPEIIHGFSTKKFGDMRDTEKRKIFLSALGIEETSLVWQEQIHKDAIRIISQSDRGKIIHGVDGLAYKQLSDDISITLSVHTADCVPLLALDPVTKVIGVAHAGWKGTILHIGRTLIDQMKQLGSSVSDVRFVIGPHIGACCYHVDDTRMQVFQREWGENSGVVTHKDGKHYVDLGQANIDDFLFSGILEKNIDSDPSLCTYCNINDFYSFRKSGAPLAGEIMGVIGFRK